MNEVLERNEMKRLSSKQKIEDSDHGKSPVIAYCSALLLMFVAQYVPNEIQNIFLIIAMILAGYHVILDEGLKETIKETKENNFFTPNSHLLMGLAALGASVLGEFWEATLLIVIFSGAHFLEDYAEGQSKREISKLMAMNPTVARLLDENNESQLVDIDKLKIGDRVQVLNGDQVPIDGIILSGSTVIDESSINGESMPKEKNVGDIVYGSTMNGNGSFIMQVTKESSDTVFASIIELINKNQQNQTKVVGKIKKYEPYYVNIVLLSIALFTILMPFVFSWSWADTIERSLNLLVSASPCALAAAGISASLSATSHLAKKGVISKGTVYLSALADIDAIAFDKTGTLTQGHPEVTHEYFVNENERERLINILVAMEKQSNHPLASALLQYFSASAEYNIATENKIGSGLEAEFEGHLYQLGKPQLFPDRSDEIEAHLKTWSDEGNTCIMMAEDKQVVAIFGMMDQSKEEALEAIRFFNEKGIYTAMISGDSQATAEVIGHQLGVNEVIANVLPEEKSDYVKKLQADHGKVAMVGDGINDAPALVQADVGVAMGQGTDVAVDIADMVLMQDNLLHLAHAQQTGKKMDRVIWQNIIFSLMVVAYLVFTGLFGESSMTLSILFHEGSTLIVILNGLRLLK